MAAAVAAVSGSLAGEACAGLFLSGSTEVSGGRLRCARPRRRVAEAPPPTACRAAASGGSGGGGRGVGKDVKRNEVVVGVRSDETAHATTSSDQLYTLVRGDTLSKVARRYSMSSKEIAAYNSLTNANYVQEGFCLRIPLRDSEGGNSEICLPPSTSAVVRRAIDATQAAPRTIAAIAANTTFRPARLPVDFLSPIPLLGSLLACTIAAAIFVTRALRKKSPSQSTSSQDQADAVHKQEDLQRIRKRWQSVLSVDRLLHEAGLTMFMSRRPQSQEAQQVMVSNEQTPVIRAEEHGRGEVGAVSFAGSDAGRIGLATFSMASPMVEDEQEGEAAALSIEDSRDAAELVEAFRRFEKESKVVRPVHGYATFAEEEAARRQKMTKVGFFARLRKVFKPEDDDEEFDMQLLDNEGRSRLAVDDRE